MSWTVFIVNQLIKTKRLLFLHPIRLYINAQTIDLTKYDYIIYTI